MNQNFDTSDERNPATPNILGLPRVEIASQMKFAMTDKNPFSVRDLHDQT
jgi:hypothetical protein